MSSIRLYTYWRSSSSYRVRIALALKGLSYESIPINLLEGTQISPAHLERNPLGQVPALEIDGKVVVQSVAILELLEELFPEPRLFPTCPWMRARVRSAVEVVNSGIQPLHNLALLKAISSDPSQREEWARQVMTKGLAALESMANAWHGAADSGPFLCGEGPTAADVFLVPQLYQARRFGVDAAPFKRLLRADEAARKLEAFQQAAPECQADAPQRS